MPVPNDFSQTSKPDIIKIYRLDFNIAYYYNDFIVIFKIMETILSKATSDTLESFKKFSQTFGIPEYIKSLLTCMNQSSVRNNQSVLVHLTRVLAALVYGNEEKMGILLDHYRSILDFNKYDFEHTLMDQQKMEMFCVLTNGIERNAIGNTLKDYIISLGIVKDALNYITLHAPCVKPTLLRTDSDELKEFISKPALKYILRILTGLAHSHENTQVCTLLYYVFICFHQSNMFQQSPTFVLTTIAPCCRKHRETNVWYCHGGN